MTLKEKIAIWQGIEYNKRVRELEELLPRYKQDNIFVSDKFKKRFPDFRVTSYQEGMEIICKEAS